MVSGAVIALSRSLPPLKLSITGTGEAYPRHNGRLIAGGFPPITSISKEQKA
jgi:hypothetical protein